MNRARSLVGFVDLTLILLGSLAMIGGMERRQKDYAEQVEMEPDRDGDANMSDSRPIGAIFEPGEARLSAGGRAWVAEVALRGAGGPLAFSVTSTSAEAGARLDGWEIAAARTASILHALRSAGYPESSLEPRLPEQGDGSNMVTFRFGSTEGDTAKLARHLLPLE